MKNILLLLFLFFLMPTVYASSSIKCVYKVEGYRVTVNVTDANEGKVVVSTKKDTSKSKLSFNTSALKDYSHYTNGSTLKCPTSIFSAKNKKKVVLSFKKTKKNKKNNLTLNSASTEQEEIPPTDWGKVEDTDLETICSKPELRKPLKFIGTIVAVLKIAIPILILVLGIMDLCKAIPSSKDDRIMIAVKSIGVRFIAGIFIFFIPGIVQLLLDWVNEWSNYQNTWCCCTQCILDSGKCDVNSCSSDSCKIGGMN